MLVWALTFAPTSAPTKFLSMVKTKIFSQNFWKGDECQRGAGLDDRSSKCYDCCDGEATASCNANFADAYKAAADVDDIEGTEFENSWKLKTGKY